MPAEHLKSVSRQAWLCLEDNKQTTSNNGPSQNNIIQPCKWGSADEWVLIPSSSTPFRISLLTKVDMCEPCCFSSYHPNMIYMHTRVCVCTCVHIYVYIYIYIKYHYIIRFDITSPHIVLYQIMILHYLICHYIILHCIRLHNIGMYHIIYLISNYVIYHIMSYIKVYHMQSYNVIWNTY